MRNAQLQKVLDVAMLPLGDGRRLMIPLTVLAEVYVLADMQETLSWRGCELPLVSLGGLCGLSEPAPGELTTVAVMRAHKDSEHPFRAFAFNGSASHARVSADDLKSGEEELGDGFLGSVSLAQQDYLIPDLVALLAA
jgi:hypothetical protein